MSTVGQWGLSGQTQTFKQTSDRVPHHFSRIMFMAIPKYIVRPIIRFHDLAVQLTESANCFYQVYLFTVVLLGIVFQDWDIDANVRHKIDELQSWLIPWIWRLFHPIQLWILHYFLKRNKAFWIFHMKWSRFQLCEDDDWPIHHPNSLHAGANYTAQQLSKIANT